MVNGYLQEIQKSTSIGVLPKDIVDQCLLFFYDGIDRFDPKLCGDFIKISDGDRRITNTKDNTYQTAYGSKVISSINEAEHTWYIKIDCNYINDYYNNHQLFVGIDNANATSINKGFTYQYGQKAWYATDADGQIFCWNNLFADWGLNRFVDNPIIELNMKITNTESKLAYYCIDEAGDRCLLSEVNIERDKSLYYRLAVGMFKKDQSVQIIDKATQEQCHRNYQEWQWLKKGWCLRYDKNGQIVGYIDD